jgi:YHS domain-containing protein
MAHLKARGFNVALPLVALLLVLTTPLRAGVPGSTSQVNVDAQGVALRGYDPVAYFDEGKPAHGSQSISTSYQGARYLFASESHRKLFLQDPKKYVPAYGGFCAVGTSFGEKVDADPETGKVVNGTLYVNYNAKTKTVFDGDTQGTISRADKNWRDVKDKAQ